MTALSTQHRPRPPASPAPADGIVDLPLGLLGFEHLKKFSLIGRDDEAPFLWLHAQDGNGMSFLVVPPQRVTDNYRPNLAAADVQFLGLTDPREALVLSIVTLGADGTATANLKGPIVINGRTRVGKQVVPLNAAEYSVRHPLPVAR